MYSLFIQVLCKKHGHLHGPAQFNLFTFQQKHNWIFDVMPQPKCVKRSRRPRCKSDFIMTTFTNEQYQSSKWVALR